MSMFQAVPFGADVFVPETERLALSQGLCELRVMGEGDIVGRWRLFGQNGQGGVQVVSELRPPVFPPTCSLHHGPSGTSFDGGAEATSNVEQTHTLCADAAQPTRTVHAEVYCCGSSLGGGTASAQSLESQLSGSGGTSLESHGSSADRDLPGEADGSTVTSWAGCPESAVPLAISAPVRFFLTAAAGPGEAHDDSYGVTGSLAPPAPPAEHLVVPFFVKQEPGVRVDLRVARWAPEGSVWESILKLCSQDLGLGNDAQDRGTGAGAGGGRGDLNLRLSDCMALAGEAVSTARGDMYQRLSGRLSAMVIDLHVGLYGTPLAVEGHTGQQPEKIAAMAGVVRQPEVLTVCEVGFNAGHSSLNWLLHSRPEVRVLSFDQGSHAYVGAAADWVEGIFPGRLKVVLGDSKETVPAFAERFRSEGRDTGVCNLIFVDGDHSREGATADLVNLAPLANRTWHRVMVDDFEVPEVHAAWMDVRDKRGLDEDGTAAVDAAGGFGVKILDIVQSGAESMYFAPAAANGHHQDGIQGPRLDNWASKAFHVHGASMLAVGEYCFAQ